jgi:hypothetical protein
MFAPNSSSRAMTPQEQNKLILHLVKTYDGLEKRYEAALVQIGVLQAQLDAGHRFHGQELMKQHKNRRITSQQVLDTLGVSFSDMSSVLNGCLTNDEPT